MSSSGCTLGPVDLERGGWALHRPVTSPSGTKWPGLDWVIVGGESGPGARFFDVAWARSIIAQCREAGVPCFVKQLGARPRGTACRPLCLKSAKGGDPSEWSPELRVREFPR